MSRTYKQPYRGSRSWDPSCRCHGGCPWCERNHQWQDIKARDAADRQLEETKLDKLDDV